MGVGKAGGEKPSARVSPAMVQPSNQLGPAGYEAVPFDAYTNMAPQLVNGSSLDETMARRRADRQVLHELTACNFTGPRYRRFEDELAAYGLSVLQGLMHSGYIFRLTAAQGFTLHPSDAELEELFRDADARDELAIMTVALALIRFREDALIRGGWRVEAGASLSTYFIGTCLYIFPNELRKWRSQRKRWSLQNNEHWALIEPDEDVTSDPAVLALGKIRVCAALKRLDERTRAIVALTIDGYTQQEIADLLGETSVRAVEGVLRRWRMKEKLNKQWGGEPDEKE
ncbi:RNA polymerase sigma factor [Micromonospora chalcea]|uniref:RNA polymerase sigma factor n=1 Tax=Micromonospora chalcea TaxID=1874 RepID=UPI0011B0CE42|nr:sigma-70 family RNA polymerase sigma factor [Micromonospora chalcea]